MTEAAGTFSTFASDFSPKKYNFMENMMVIDRPAEMKVAIMLW